MAAGVDPAEPAVVVHANRVVDVTPAARDEGVVPGLRRRESQSRCPGLVVLDHDPSRDARWFEPVVAAGRGTLPAQLVELAGGVNVVESERYPRLGIEAVLASEPEVILQSRMDSIRRELTYDTLADLDETVMNYQVNGKTFTSGKIKSYRFFR
mgnify:CR=1 FL=1